MDIHMLNESMVDEFVTHVLQFQALDLSPTNQALKKQTSPQLLVDYAHNLVEIVLNSL